MVAVIHAIGNRRRLVLRVRAFKQLHAGIATARDARLEAYLLAQMDAKRLSLLLSCLGYDGKRSGVEPPPASGALISRVLPPCTSYASPATTGARELVAHASSGASNTSMRQR
mgnify:CR=1 FL=1